MADSNSEIVVIGAGPAGLTAAHELSKLGRRSVILEQDDQVGGISRTCEFEGYRFDIGGHRFFTKVDYVRQIWREILGNEMLTRPRLSRIYHDGKFFDYPLKPLNALLGLGPVEAVRIGLSFLRAQIAPAPRVASFEDWVVSRFGRRLFEIFFKTYTEKVWGMPCSQISADWASQRIRQLDLLVAVRNALIGSVATGQGEVVTSLIEEFEYPRHGPGQMWERCRDMLSEFGSKTMMETEVISVQHARGQVTGVVAQQPGMPEYLIRTDQVLSSMPVRTLLRCLDPAPPESVLRAAERLNYRDFLTVALIIEEPDLFQDNWIYIHSDEVQVGRVQNFKNWSPDMVPDQQKTALGLEYFVQEGDALWSLPDDELIALGTRECETLGLASADKVVGGSVVRMPKAYPVYDGTYQESLTEIRSWLDQIGGLQLIGRNGQHRYNNQDHSMMTGVYAARNIVGSEYDIWDVNVEEDYHEERDSKNLSTSGDRLVPSRIEIAPLERRIRELYARIDPVALGSAMGMMTGVTLFLATVVLLLRGAETSMPNISLLGNYFLGYGVSWFGALVGLIEGSLAGYLLGWSMASLTNLVMRIEERKTFAAFEAGQMMNLYEADES